MSSEFQTYRELQESLGHSRDANRATEHAILHSHAHATGIADKREHETSGGYHQTAAQLHGYAAGQSDNKFATAYHDHMAKFHQGLADLHYAQHNNK